MARGHLTTALAARLSAILPSTGWHGFHLPRDEPPAPHPDTWGKGGSADTLPLEMQAWRRFHAGYTAPFFAAARGPGFEA